MRVVLTGGGTGGHVTPLLPVVDVLRRSSQEKVEVFFAGVVTAHIRELLAAYDIPTYHIPSGKLRRYASVVNVVDMMFRLPFGILVALVRLWWLMPDMVLSKGGYGGVPIVLAAWFYRIPILLHESDVVPGLANRALAPLATIIAVGYEETRSYFGRQRRKTVVTGIPIKFDFGATDGGTAKEAFGWSSTDIVIVITGGSQGAAQLNEVTLKILPQLVTEVKIIHVTGPKHFAAVTAVARQLLDQSAYQANYRAYAALTDQMALAMSAADIIVSRAGATTLAEIAHLQKPSLLIPLPGSAQDSQRQNATVFEQRGAARVLDSNNVGPHLFHRSLEELIRSPHLREQLGTKAGSFDHPHAAHDLAELIRKLAQGLAPAYTP